MFVAVTMGHGDNEQYIEYVDTDKLVQGDFVDMEVLKAVEAGETHLLIDASEWEVKEIYDNNT